ncbi:MAG: phosphoglucosamine mutase [Acidobacteria bacterium]|nr:phosphoglucosamine mutase [Acidobacteriota bacterium]
MTSPKPSPRLFGTDGIRGAFGEAPLDRATVTAVGYRLAQMLGAGGEGPSLILGGDTRDSTPEICAWLAAGLEAGGGEARFLGVVPTPAIALLVRRHGADAGIAVSASHNPWPDNGIKLVSRDGFKWSRADEAELEAGLEAAREHLASLAPSASARALTSDPSGATEYLDLLAATVPGERPLAGLRVLLDTAHGAASAYAAPLFERLGAAATVLFDSPDGRNINRGCGSTEPQALARAMTEGDYHLGIAFDGDADRALLVDETGEVRDGDAMLYLWASRLAATGRLEPPKIVATTMSNLGLERALARHGVGLERCDVGDREVVETLRREGLRLGGEQSGHLVDLELSSTGDGLLTAIQLAALVAANGEPLSRQLEGFRRYPQVLTNVRVREKQDLASLSGVVAARQRVEARLGDDGRLVLRYSGTEPLARVMIEGPEQTLVDELAEDLAGAIRSAIGA